MSRKRYRHPEAVEREMIERAARSLSIKQKGLRITFFMRNGERRYMNAGSDWNDARKHVAQVFAADDENEYYSAEIREQR